MWVLLFLLFLLLLSVAFAAGCVLLLLLLLVSLLKTPPLPQHVGTAFPVVAAAALLLLLHLPLSTFQNVKKNFTIDEPPLTFPKVKNKFLYPTKGLLYIPHAAPGTTKSCEKSEELQLRHFSRVEEPFVVTVGHVRSGDGVCPSNEAQPSPSVDAGDALHVLAVMIRQTLEPGT